MPKVIISTDLGGDDKDDSQSFVHALLYANEIDYRGFVTTRTDDVGKGVPLTNGPAEMRQIIDAYGTDLANLRKADPGYPDAAKLKSLITPGQMTDSTWPGGLSEGARLIVDEARAASPGDPLYVLVWGPIHDVARALYAAPDIVDNIRIISSAAFAQDSKNPAALRWMENAIASDPAYRDLWWIASEEGIRGMYLQPGKTNVDSIDDHIGWIKANADGHGALGDLFNDKLSKDLYKYAEGQSSVVANGLKMGDTPTLLYLLDSVDDDNPGAASWGGRFQKSGLGPNHWVDIKDPALAMSGYDGARTVYQHRDAAWGDFAERLDWAKGGTTAAPAPAPTAPAAGRAIDVGTNEAEALALSGGYAVETLDGFTVARNGGTGSISGEFAGESGTYSVAVRYLDENDGASRFTLTVDGRVVDSWTASAGTNRLETRAVTVSLDRGDDIVLTSTKDNGEFARVDAILVQKVAAAATPAPAPAAPVSGATLTVGTNEAEGLDLSGGYGVEQRDGFTVARNANTGTISGEFTGEGGDYLLSVRFVNEPDGASNYRLTVDGKVVDGWTATGGSYNLETRTVKVSLANGDGIVLASTKDNGEFARVDAILLEKAGGLLSAAAPVAADTGGALASAVPQPMGATFGLGRNEMEDFDLGGAYQTESIARASGGKVIKSTSEGTASATFDGDTDDYVFDFAYFNENDGVARYTLAVNGNEVGSWSGEGGDNGIERHRIEVALARGDVVEVAGVKDNGEFARLDCVDLFLA